MWEDMEDNLRESLERFLVEFERIPSKSDFRDVPYLRGYSTYRRYLGGTFLSSLKFEYTVRDLKCLCCSEPMSYSSRLNKYCSRSCASKINGHLYPKRGDGSKSKCIRCGETCRKGRKYCSTLCSSQSIYESSVSEWLSGHHKGWSGKTRQLSGFIRRYLKDFRGSACSMCGWDENHPVDGNSLTEIDHVDGDAENCRPENLQILCPNCHSMTPTHRARNKGSKRQR